MKIRHWLAGAAVLGLWAGNCSAPVHAAGSSGPGTQSARVMVQTGAQSYYDVFHERETDTCAQGVSSCDANSSTAGSYADAEVWTKTSGAHAGHASAPPDYVAAECAQWSTDAKGVMHQQDIRYSAWRTITVIGTAGVSGADTSWQSTSSTGKIGTLIALAKPTDDVWGAREAHLSGEIHPNNSVMSWFNPLRQYGGGTDGIAMTLTGTIRNEHRVNGRWVSDPDTTGSMSCSTAGDAVKGYLAYLHGYAYYGP